MKGIDICRQYEGLNRYTDRQKIQDLIDSQARDGDIDEDPKTEAWCAGWMNFCERSAGKPGTGSLAALSFRNYGQDVDLEDIQEGDILVFQFDFDSPWQGHVTYFDGFKGTSRQYVSCLGGNQSNCVQRSTYPISCIKSIRRS